MKLGTLGTSLLTGRGLFRTGQGMYLKGEDLKEEDYLVQDKELKKKSLTLFHPLTNFAIIDYFKDEPRFNLITY